MLRHSPKRTQKTSSCRLLGTLLLALCCVAAAPVSAAPPVQATQWAYLEDAAGTLAPGEALAMLRAGQGRPFDAGRFSLGNRDSRFWLYARVGNGGVAAARRLFAFGIPYRRHLQVFTLAAGAEPGAVPTPFFRTGQWERYAQRSSRALTLHTPVFELAPGETREFLFDYHTRGATFMPVTLQAPQMFFAAQQRDEVRAAYFYAAAVVLLVVFFMFGLAMRDRYALGYAGMYSLGLLFVAAIEGYGYRYLWPDLPLWNQYASLFLLLLAIAYSFALAHLALAPPLRPPWLLRGLRLLALLAAACALGCSTLPFALLVDFAGLLLLLAMLAQLLTVCSWLGQAVTRNLLSVAATLVIVPLSLVLLVLTQIGVDLPDLVLLYSVRAGFFAATLLTLGALSIHVLALQYDHEQSLETALVAARRDAQLSRELYESRREYERVQRVAERWQRHYAETSHDIRQPLLSMRAALAGGELRAGSEQWDNLARALDYLEALSGPGAEVHPDTGEVAQPGAALEEPYPASLVIDTITRMFSDEARARGVRLRAHGSSFRLQVTPLVLMRILSNLVANAIAHAGGGEVLLGCRRRAGGLRFDVIDNGPGIPAAELRRLQRPYEKGNASQGEGLGLAICWQLAAGHGLDMGVQSARGRGTRFSLFVPGV
ncbi:MAG: hypothetical protein CME59_08730 [Halioglobus sp.]|nr:hypothetical protein [Halioglobus sp.]